MPSNFDFRPIVPRVDGDVETSCSVYIRIRPLVRGRGSDTDYKIELARERVCVRMHCNLGCLNVDKWCYLVMNHYNYLGTIYLVELHYERGCWIASWLTKLPRDGYCSTPLVGANWPLESCSASDAKHYERQFVRAEQIKQTDSAACFLTFHLTVDHRINSLSTSVQSSTDNIQG